MSPELRYALENNAFIFSGFKTFHALREVGLSMVNGEGGIKSFEEFKEDVRRINSTYNTNYLYAEYKHAVGTSQMAVKWNDIQQDGDRYLLQYRTAGDDKVREDHRLLDGTTLPPSDPFWSKYYPPNGWGCRCTAVQVRRGKYPESDPVLAMTRGDNATEAAKQKMFRYNAGMEMQLFPPKHPYYKAPAKAKAVAQKVSTEEMERQRTADFEAELPATFTTEQRLAIAQNCIEIEKELKIRKGKPMTIEQADEQKANPNHIPRFILDPKGSYVDKQGRHYRLNPNWSKAKAKPFNINCATCAPAYALRLRGFNVTAKGRKKGTLNESVAFGRSFELWKNADGTPAQPTLTYKWMTDKGYGNMTPKRYKEYFEEVCKEQGVYILTIGWKGKRGGGHATILQRDADGKLYYIEPQEFDSALGAKRPIDSLCNDGAKIPTSKRGILRVDDKVFDTAFLPLFGV